MTRISKIQRSVYLRYYGIEHKKNSSLHFDENKKKERVFTLRTKMDYFNTMGRLGEAFKIHE